MNKGFLKVEEAAVLPGVSSRTVWNHIRAGRIETVKKRIGSRSKARVVISEGKILKLQDSFRILHDSFKIKREALWIKSF